MKPPLRFLAVFTVGFLCFGCCHRARAAQSPRAHLASIRAAGPAGEGSASAAPATVLIPGPLRSFLRMAGISQQVAPDDVLPMLARNVSLWGHESGRDTEFLVLLSRYVQLARDLHSLAGADGVIRVSDCGDAVKLIQILGYQFQRSCGLKDASLATQNAERAFLTVDSGFPLTTLEQCLQNHTAFSYPFPATPVPILFTERDWTNVSLAKKRGRPDLLELLLHDPTVDRLYAALARSDDQTRLALSESPGLRKLMPVAAVLDFYGSQISIRSGRVAVPGGPSAEHAWQELVGASPSAQGEFITHLLERDRGWLAAYFDALSRVNPDQQARLTEGPRLKFLYDAYRSADPRDSASAGVFPKNAELLLLYTRLQWGADGEPRVPGNTAPWAEVFDREMKIVGAREWGRRVHNLDTPERLLEGLVVSSNVETDIGPLQIYLTLSAIDAGRPVGQQLSPETVRRLATSFVRFNNWFSVFAEFPALDDTAITSFIDTADRIDKIGNQTLRANALGAFQADIGLWQIFARQRQIPADKLNASWQGAVRPFAGVASSEQLFDAARGSLQASLVAAAGTPNLTQDQIIDLLAGPSQDSPESQRVHQEMAHRIHSVLEDQRLVSLDALFGLYDGLNDLAHGAHIGNNLLQLAGDLREFEMPRPIFTSGEKTSWSPVIYTNRHAELQVRTDLTSVIRTPGSPAQLQAARGRLTPFLRDTLVGLNYAYYEPPGAQVLHNNPLFVRSHDFSTVSVQGVRQIWGPPELIGIGVTAGGGAYLMGSLADLPYALASVEQDFIAPDNVQALIWKETVPQLLVDAIVPRWWNVSKDELHAADLYQRTGEELLKAGAADPQIEQRVLAILAERIAPGHLERIEAILSDPARVQSLSSEVLPAVTFYLAVEYRRKFPDAAALPGPAGKELDALVRRDPSETSPERLSRDFGVPHPSMAQSDACTLMNTGLFPVSGGYTSRLFAESWESSNLYWARLADEMGYSPVMLNILVPELTRQMIVNIFATNIDDWPALLRAMHETGEDFRQGRIGAQPADGVRGPVAER
jgi:hypothetical protein